MAFKFPQRNSYAAIVPLATMLLLAAFPPRIMAEDNGRFKEVEPGIWRGGIPRKGGLMQLKKMGVRTVVDLMDEDPEKWMGIAKSLDMKYVNIPLRRTRPIPADAIKQFLSVVEDPANKPVYVHCRSGRDRTGAMIAIYRIHADKWTVAKARGEMRSRGFNPMFHYLSRSVVDFDSETPGKDAIDTTTLVNSKHGHETHPN